LALKSLLSQLADVDRTTIEDFLESISPMSEVRLQKYRAYLGWMATKLGKPLDETTRKDLVGIWHEIDSMEAELWTKRDYGMMIKRFFRWFRNEEFVRGFKVQQGRETVGPEDVLADEELSRIYHACHSLRDKALSATAYEAALRPHELIRLKKNDVMFDDYGAIVYVRPPATDSNAKTGARRVRVINAAPLLANWIENHPRKERDGPLWVDMSSNTTFEQLKWTGYRRIVQRWAREAKIEKKLSAYLFRHSRLTALSKFMTEAQLCVFAGWAMGSDMPRMYVHLSGRDIDDALLEAYGLKKRKAEEARVPRKCVRCGTFCDAEAETCFKCGMALSLTAAMKKDDELAEIRANQARILELLQKGVRVDQNLLNLRGTDLSSSKVN
jgi:integrase/recombinase XerD